MSLLLAGGLGIGVAAWGMLMWLPATRTLRTCLLALGVAAWVPLTSQLSSPARAILPVVGVLLAAALLYRFRWFFAPLPRREYDYQAFLYRQWESVRAARLRSIGGSDESVRAAIRLAVAEVAARQPPDADWLVVRDRMLRILDVGGNHEDGRLSDSALADLQHLRPALYSEWREVLRRHSRFIR